MHKNRPGSGPVFFTHDQAGERPRHGTRRPCLAQRREQAGERAPCLHEKPQEKSLQDYYVMLHLNLIMGNSALNMDNA